VISIYHNPRCRKSREALEILNESGHQFEIREYLKQPPTREELIELLEKLKLRPLELIRKGESIFKEKYKGKEFSDKEWIEIMVESPILIERPVVIRSQQAVVGRPVTRVIELLKG
jgi:arsenate reductase